jgi:ABC-2 type transport system permease protein
MKLSAVKAKRIFNIWKMQLWQGLMQRMTFRLNFVLMCVGVLLHMVVYVALISVIFQFVNNISGWSYFEALLVAGSYMMIEGLMWAIFSFFNGLKNHIRMGTLDYILVKPIDTQFMVSIYRGDPEDWTRVVTGFIVLYYSISHLPAILMYNLFFYVLMLLFALVIAYSFNLIVKSLSFWFVDAGATFTMTENIFRCSQYPIDIFYHRLIRLLFISVIPIAFLATFPAKILLRGFDPVIFFSAIIIAVIFFVLSRIFWLYALKHYSGASS